MFAFALKGLLWAGTSVATASATSAMTEAAVKRQFKDVMDRVFSSWEWDKKATLAGGSLMAVNLVFNSETLNPLLANFGLELLPGQGKIDSLRISFTLGVSTLFSEPWEVEVLDSKLEFRLLSPDRASAALRQNGDEDESSEPGLSCSTTMSNASMPSQPPSASPPLRSASGSQATRKEASSLRFYEKVFPLLTAFENLRVTVRQLEVRIVDALADVGSSPVPTLSWDETNQLNIKVGKLMLRTTTGPPDWTDTFHRDPSKSGGKVFKAVAVEGVEIVSMPISMQANPESSPLEANPSRPALPSTLLKGIDLSLFLTKTRKEGLQGLAGFLGSSYEVQAAVKGEGPTSLPRGSCEAKVSIRYDNVLDCWDISLDSPITMNLRHTLGTLEFRDLNLWLTSFTALAKASAPDAERQLVTALRWQAIEHAAMIKSREETNRLLREAHDLRTRLQALERSEDTRNKAIESLIQGLRVARTQSPSKVAYDPVGQSDGAHYERLLDEVDQRLVRLLPQQPQAPRPPAPTPLNPASQATSSTTPVSDPQTTRNLTTDASWKEASGRKAGGEGYRFGDFTRSLLAPSKPRN